MVTEANNRQIALYHFSRTLSDFAYISPRTAKKCTQELHNAIHVHLPLNNTHSQEQSKPLFIVSEVIQKYNSIEQEKNTVSKTCTHIHKTTNIMHDIMLACDDKNLWSKSMIATRLLRWDLNILSFL